MESTDESNLSNTQQFILTNIEALTEEHKQWLADQRQLPLRVLDHFLEVLTVRHIPSSELDSKLRQMAKRFTFFHKTMATLPSSSPVIQTLHQQAQQAVEEAAFPRVESLLNEAGDQAKNIAQTMIGEEKNSHLLSAAASKAVIGDLKQSELAYREAALSYQEAVNLLPDGNESTMATYLHGMGVALVFGEDYAEAENPLTRALAMREEILPAFNVVLGESLFYLNRVYQKQRRYAEAEPLCQRALAIYENEWGPEHPTTAEALLSLAVLSGATGRKAEAEPLCQRALAIREKKLGPEHPATAKILYGLTTLSRELGRYTEAETFSQRALAIQEKVLGPEHPDTATSLDTLAVLYDDTGRYGESEPLYQRALAIQEKVLGPEHPDTARSLNNLAGLYTETKRYAKAEPLY